MHKEKKREVRETGMETEGEAKGMPRPTNQEVTTGGTSLRTERKNKRKNCAQNQKLLERTLAANKGPVLSQKGQQKQRGKEERFGVRFQLKPGQPGGKRGAGYTLTGTK